MPIPAWVFKALAAIGGWNVLEKLGLPALQAFYDRIMERHDEPVWVVVREPKYQKFSSANNFVVNPQIELPYSVQEIADRLSRKSSSIIASLKRLEKRGKVKDVHGGWQRN